MWWFSWRHTLLVGLIVFALFNLNILFLTSCLITCVILGCHNIWIWWILAFDSQLCRFVDLLLRLQLTRHTDLLWWQFLRHGRSSISCQSFPTNLRSFRLITILRASLIERIHAQVRLKRLFRLRGYYAHLVVQAFAFIICLVPTFFQIVIKTKGIIKRIFSSILIKIEVALELLFFIRHFSLSILITRHWLLTLICFKIGIDAWCHILWHSLFYLS